MLKEIGPRKLIVSSLTGIMILAIGIFENPSEFSFLIVLASFLCAGVSLLRWMVLYDKLNPEEAAVYSVLSYEHPLSVDEIIYSLKGNGDASSIAFLLLQMELKGLVVENKSHAYLRAERE